MDRLNQELFLSDGRRLGFAEYGPVDGTPLFYFHGWPSSRLEPAAVERQIVELGLRVIAPDRPGFGASDLNPGRSIGVWTQDVRELADYLRLPTVAVLGVSGGGPYAAACAALIPDRLTTVSLVCSLSPLEAPNATAGMVALNRWLLALARNMPWLAEKIALACLRAFWGTGDQAIPHQIETRLSESDRRVLADPGIREKLTASSREGLRRGVEGAAEEGFLYARPWGFDLEKIRRPVHLWQGEKDVVVPPAMGRYLAREIPNCRTKFFPEEGHFSLPFGRMREILGALKV